MGVRPFRALPIAAAIALAGGGASTGCGGQTLDYGYDDATVKNANPAAPVDLRAVKNRCAAAGAIDQPYTTDAASRALLAGRWFLCESSGDAGWDVPAAIELTADGAWFLLTPNDAGVFARDSARAGTFETASVLSCCYPQTWVVTFRDSLARGDAGASADLAGFYLTFRSGPLQMLWAPSSSQGAAPRPTVARFVPG